MQSHSEVLGGLRLQHTNLAEGSGGDVGGEEEETAYGTNADSG